MDCWISRRFIPFASANAFAVVRSADALTSRPKSFDLIRFGRSNVSGRTSGAPGGGIRSRFLPNMDLHLDLGCEFGVFASNSIFREAWAFGLIWRFGPRAQGLSQCRVSPMAGVTPRGMRHDTSLARTARAGTIDSMNRLTRRRFLVLAPCLGMGACARFEPPHVHVEDYDGRKVRVACVGDSITFGAGVEDRDKNHYPSVLGSLLGTSFDVRNFGRSGATLSRLGDLPYWSTDEFKAATAFSPDVVVLKLGTNDTKPQNWKGKDAFAKDFDALLDHFLGLRKKPRTKVWVCLPVPVFATQWGINAKTLDEGVIPVLMDTSQRRKVPVIDLNDALSAHPEMFPDKIHPNAAGARLIARTIFQAIRP